MKRCTVCGVLKPATDEFFHRRGTGELRFDCKECGAAYQRRYRAANPEKVVARGAKWRAEHAQQHKARCDAWNRDHGPEHARRNRSKYRELVYDHYGRECVCCGESEPLFLTIDHVNNDGNVHRRELGPATHRLYVYLVKNNFPEGFQVLCRNCNWGKHANGGVCPHQTTGVKS